VLCFRSVTNWVYVDVKGLQGETSTCRHSWIRACSRGAVGQTSEFVVALSRFWLHYVGLPYDLPEFTNYIDASAACGTSSWPWRLAFQCRHGVRLFWCLQLHLSSKDMAGYSNYIIQFLMKMRFVLCCVLSPRILEFIRFCNSPLDVQKTSTAIRHSAFSTVTG
jgi:hypothetical protein